VKAGCLVLSDQAGAGCPMTGTLVKLFSFQFKVALTTLTVCQKLQAAFD
jgi:hypothetical protein